MNPRNFSVPQLAAEYKKLLSRNRNGSRRFKGFIEISNRYGPRLILFVVVTAFLLSTLSGLPNKSLSGGAQVSAATESISTFASNCSTPDASFNLGETVCAVVTGAQLPISGRRQRRFQWVAPDGTALRLTDIVSDPQSDSFTIPATGDFAQVGTWTVKTINNNGAGFATTSFLVRNPANASVDISVIKNGPFQAAAGSNITYTIYVTNRGPDDATNVVLTDTVPGNATFVSETQVSGPTASCTNPSSGSSTGSTVCTIATLAVNETAVFSVVYNINAATPDGTELTNTAIVTSTTNELHTPDNTGVAATTVTADAQTCHVFCPGDITQAADPGQCLAIVNYSSPESSGNNCGTIQCSPPAGSTFPSGTTTVTCGGQTGDPCSFTITVTGNDSEAPTITCPANLTAEVAPGGSGTRVDYPAPETSDNCSTVTTSCTPASGSIFPTGTTTVTCTATDASNNSANCSFTITVNETVEDCELTCGPNITKSVDPNECTAVVTYNAPSSTGELCGTIVCSPASGSTFHIGVTVVSCTGNGSASCSFSVTVTETVPPTITTCASDKTIQADSNCMAPIPELTGEVAATDNCSDVTIVQSPAADTMVGVGDTVVTIRVSDSSGNEATCTATVHVEGSTTPPSITCPANVTRPTDANQCSAVVNYPPPTVSGGCSGSGTATCTPPAGSTFPKGTTTVTCTANGGGANCSFTVTVNDTQSPSITCPANITVNAAAGQCGAVVTYPAVTTSDNCSGVTVAFSPASGSTFPVGTTTVTATATDASGNTQTCTFTVSVVDNQPPQITVNSQTITLSPPNHDYHTFNVSSLIASVSDNCGSGVSVNSVVITKVTSDEPENGNGDGDTLNDMVIAANCKSVQLRSERQGSGNGRVYTVFFKLMDASGNVATATKKITVLKGNGPAVDSGPVYTVTSSCQ